MKLVLTLSRTGKIGAVLVFAGVALGVYARLEGVPSANRVSIVIVTIGAVLYYSARFRSFRRKRKP